MFDKPTMVFAGIKAQLIDKIVFVCYNNKKQGK